MNYYLDTEFIEGFTSPTFGKRRHFIDLVSIGIVCEDGREYYAISREFDPKDASPWVRENVLKHLPPRTITQDLSPRLREEVRQWKTNKQIAREIVDFVEDAPDGGAPMFYGYFADYDWVLLCSLFGSLLKLPNGWPHVCMDLKQMMHEAGLDNTWKAAKCPTPENTHHALEDARWNQRLHTAIQRETKNYAR
jgi:hypothetical protein